MNSSTPRLKVLIACEESQAECKEFRALGHEAFSCDLQPNSGGHPEWHIIGDCLPLLAGCCTFVTQDGSSHWNPLQWDLIIAHPPCTYLTKVGAVRLFNKQHQIKDEQRYNNLLQAREFFMKCYDAPAAYVAVENPMPMHIANLPKRSCVIQPYEFGEPYSKCTWLWLRNLPPLMPTYHVSDRKSWVYSVSGAKRRSKSFEGIAKAMALQWSAFIIEDMGRRGLL